VLLGDIRDRLAVRLEEDRDQLLFGEPARSPAEPVIVHSGPQGERHKDRFAWESRVQR
jgi:hypothetical protein